MQLYRGDAVIVPVAPAPKHKPSHTRGQPNKTETAWLEQLELRKLAGEVRLYRFESWIFPLADTMTYCPDAMVLFMDGRVELHEIKACAEDGRFLTRDGALEKLKMAAEMYQMFSWLLVGRGRNGLWRERRIR
jgi:hypothetical protein